MKKYIIIGLGIIVVSIVGWLIIREINYDKWYNTPQITTENVVNTIDVDTLNTTSEITIDSLKKDTINIYE